MVRFTDGLGRALYDLDTTTNQKYHPYTGENVSDDFEYEYSTQDKRFEKWDNILNIAPFLILGIGSMLVCFYILFIK